ncbi:Kininogen [Oryzias melastigma]|uniref:Kininogen n=1 Tax=Oryzias melastigma TaxID=30732 RepID=A0A834C7X6_ORYME|nr:Kininogen [Oryzias melastigma]
MMTALVMLHDECFQGLNPSVSSSSLGPPPLLQEKLTQSSTAKRRGEERSSCIFTNEAKIRSDTRMRREAGWCLLGLLCLHSTVFAQDVEPPMLGTLAPCDDPTVEKAVFSALTHINKNIVSGNKLVLFQIQFANKVQNGSDSGYFVEFTSRRSNCPAGFAKPWTECDYVKRGRKKPFSCNATVYLTDTETDVKHVQCLLGGLIFPERAPCLGCPEDVDENSEDLKVPFAASISKYNAMSDSTHLYTLNEIAHATRQVIAGFRFRLRFELKNTTCAKADHEELNQLCAPNEENPGFVNCNSTVDLAPWRLEAPEVQIQCEDGRLPKTFQRRRPPGWSPLRNFLHRVPSTASPPTPPPTTAATTAATKESSEEEVGLAEPNNPFHCPSKPWKPHKRHNPLGGSKMMGKKPPAKGAFSDTDLLSVS